MRDDPIFRMNRLIGTGCMDPLFAHVCSVLLLK